MLEPDWHPLSPEARADPPAAQAVLRDGGCPVAWTDDLGGFWSVLRYEDVVAVARDTETFSNALKPRLGTARVPLETDRPDHPRYRRLLQPHFSPQRMRELEPRVRDFVAELLEPLLAAGGGDVAPALTYPLPARVVCELLDVPDGDWPLIKRASDEVFEAAPEQRDDPDAHRAANARLVDYCRELVAGGRCRMANDLLAGGVDRETTVGAIRLMISAGHDSTTSALGISILRLAESDEIQARLRREPELIPAAAEEFVRHETPVQAMVRFPVRDVELGGRTLRRGEQVELVWGSANRDPAAFPEPERCLVDRTPNKHLVPGVGIHKCIGMPLAQLELRVALEELLARTARIRLAGPAVRTSWPRWGVSSLPLEVDARA
jgi:cytochrome P450